MGKAFEHQLFGMRLGVASLLVSLLIGLLALRLWYLQGMRGGYYREQSENNRTAEIRIIPPRGTVYDRENRVIARSRPSFDIALLFELVKDPDQTLHQLATLTGRAEAELKAQLLAQNKATKAFEPKVVIADASREELAKVKVHGYALPGVIVNVTPTRSYPYGELATHVLGYTRKIEKTDRAKLDPQRYFLDDVVGKSGIESTYEDVLKGESGFVRVEVDALGNRRGELGIVEYESGDDVYLTLDLDLQRVAEESLQGRKGSIVVLDPRNGEVLALASAPAFDPNVFSGRIAPELWNQVMKDKRHPLNNRAISSHYAPGSTFKLIMAIAGLAEKKVTPATEFFCPGYYMFAGRPYRCHKRSGHGSVNLQTAVTVSCDSYFYQLGQALGVNAIYRYATMFGLGALTGIDLPGEKSGIVPSEQWKLTTKGERWYPGETLSVSIGQGFLTATPLQMAVEVGAIAVDGKVFQPMLVRKVVSAETGEVLKFPPKLLRRSDLDPKLFQMVREYAISVVQDPRGTGKAAQVVGIQVAGKTGTAQVVSLDKSEASEEFQDHAWFIAFAPADAPTIALSIIVENGGHGGATAAPISRKLMEVYFAKLGLFTPPPGETSGAVETPVAEGEESQQLPHPGIRIIGEGRFGIGSV